MKKRILLSFLIFGLFFASQMSAQIVWEETFSYETSAFWSVSFDLCEGQQGNEGKYVLTSGTVNGVDIPGLSAEFHIMSPWEYMARFIDGSNYGQSQGAFGDNAGGLASNIDGTLALDGMATQGTAPDGSPQWHTYLNVPDSAAWAMTAIGHDEAGDVGIVFSGNMLTLTSVDGSVVLTYEREPNTCADFWTWTPHSSVGNGSLAGANTAMTSATSANGSMVLNYDFLRSGGVQANLPGQPYPQVTCHLESPVIDLSANSDALALRMTELYRRLNPVDQNTPFFSVSYSIDGGMTWSDPIDVNPNSVSNDDPILETVEFPIPQIAGQANVKLRITYSGDFYYWVIDDLQLVVRAESDMQASQEWYGIAPNTRTPVSQVEEFAFICDIENVGGTTQTGVNLNMTIVDGSGSQVYTVDEAYGTITPDSLAENVVFGGFTPDAVAADYTATYTVSSDEMDSTPDDNVISFEFSVTDSTFAKETGPSVELYPAAGNWDDGEPRSWAYGNYYYINNTEWNGKPLHVSSVNLGIVDANTIAGEIVNLALYYWAEDTNEDGNADPDERFLVALTEYVIQGTEGPITTIPFSNQLDDEPAFLEFEGSYILMAEYNAIDDQTAVWFWGSDDYDYGAMILNSSEETRFAGFLGINGNLNEEPYSWVGFGWDLVPLVRMNVTEYDPNSTNDFLSDDNVITIAPNPAAGTALLSLDLVENAKEVTVQVFDYTGKMMNSTTLENIQKGTMDLDVSNLANGFYPVKVITENGMKALTLIVKH